MKPAAPVTTHVRGTEHKTYQAPMFTLGGSIRGRGRETRNGRW